MPIRGYHAGGGIAGSSEHAAGSDDVMPNLRFERIDRGKFLFRAKFFDKGKFYLLPVDVASEVEEMNFRAKLRFGMLQRRTIANVQDGFVGFSTHFGLDSIHRIRRNGQMPDIEIRGRVAQLAPQLVALNHYSGGRIRAAQHLAGSVEIAIADGVANAGAADGFSVQRNRCQSVHDEFEFLTKSFEQWDIARALISESEIAPHADAVNVSKVSHQTTDENVATLLTEGEVKADQENCVHAERAYGAKFLGQRIDQGGRALRRDDSARVAIECDGYSKSAMLPGVGDGSPDYLLMAQMNAIKDTDGHAHIPQRIREVRGVLNDLHNRRDFWSVTKLNACEVR